MAFCINPVSRNYMTAMRLGMILLVLSGLMMTTGCSWFRGGEKEDVISQPTEDYQADQQTGMDDTVAPPSVETEGPRPGETLPFPELQVIYFDFDKSDIRPDQLERIDNNLQYLLNHPNDKVLIEGHCDERGSLEYNFALGMRRASSVRDYYVSHGVDPERIAIISYGEEQPAVLGHDEEAWAKNRRAEFKRMF